MLEPDAFVAQWHDRVWRTRVGADWWQVSNSQERIWQGEYVRRRQSRKQLKQGGYEGADQTTALPVVPAAAPAACPQHTARVEAPVHAVGCSSTLMPPVPG